MFKKDIASNEILESLLRKLVENNTTSLSREVDKPALQIKILSSLFGIVLFLCMFAYNFQREDLIKDIKENRDLLKEFYTDVQDSQSLLLRIEHGQNQNTLSLEKVLDKQQVIEDNYHQVNATRFKKSDIQPIESKLLLISENQKDIIKKIDSSEDEIKNNTRDIVFIKNKLDNRTNFMKETNLRLNQLEKGK